MSQWPKFCAAIFVLAFGWNVGAVWNQEAQPTFPRAASVSRLPGHSSSRLVASSRRAAAQPANANPTPSFGAASIRPVLNQYCVSCHNARLKTANLALDTLSVEDVSRDPVQWEKVVRKLRGTSMPPAGRPRPDAATYGATATALEDALDRVAAAHPNPGRTTAHRLNRNEYANAIRDLLGLEVDATNLLPSDDADLGFDNMADILSFSPVLLERVMSAAQKISRLAIGDPQTTLTTETYLIPKLRFQDYRMDEELPFGSRGGLAARYHFPADAEYDLKIDLRKNLYDYIRGLQREQELEVRLDGVRIKTFTIGGDVPGTPTPESFSGARLTDREWEDYTHYADKDLTLRFSTKAGPHVVGVAFVQGRSERDGVQQPRATGKYLALTETWSSPSEAPEASVDRIMISGPHHASGFSETATRKKILVCRPTRRAEEDACATRILSNVARRAFRRPLTSEDVKAFMGFYTSGRKDGSFETGIRRGLESILVDPEFLFRIERDPASAGAGANYRVTDLELASRLSFFLWSSIPDDELLTVATEGKLKDPAVFEHQVRRMLADARASALVKNFANQWLSLRKLRAFSPTPELYIEFDDLLRQAFQDETELFIESQLREDRNLMDLVRADYTFVNERLAKHYGIPNVYGSRFRRVKLTDGSRGGLLGQGSVLSVTSYPNRTSPVVRGHWLLETVLGTPPPPPPPDVPSLPEKGRDGRPTSVRERLEEHRKNAVCANCHAPMDPLGFALEHFDAIGKWRTTGEGGAPIDASGTIPGGKKFEGLPGLRDVLSERPDQFVSAMTEKLMMYALGRGLEHYDMPQVRAIVKHAAANDYRWSAVILGIAKSLPFQMRRSES